MEIEYDLHGFVASLSKDHVKLFIAKKTKYNVWSKRYETKSDPVYYRMGKERIGIGLGALLVFSKHNPHYKFKLRNIVSGSYSFDPVDYVIPDSIQLRSYQKEALDKLQYKRCGVVQLPTGSGKSYIEAILASSCGQVSNSIIFVPRKVIYHELRLTLEKLNIKWRDYAKSRNKFEGDNGIVYLTTPITVYNDFKNKRNTEVLKSIGTAVWDECHRLSCVTWITALLALTNLNRSFAFSATPGLPDFPFIDFLNVDSTAARVISGAGDVAYSKSAKDLANFIDIPLIYNLKYQWTYENMRDTRDWKKVEELMHKNEDRFQFIVDTIRVLDELDRNSLIVVDRKAFGVKLLNKLNMEEKAICWYGNNDVFSTKENFSVDQAKEYIANDKIKHVIATSHIDEGIDLPNLSSIILNSGKGSRSQIQRTGRTTRRGNRKSIVINISDRGQKVLVGHGRKRVKSLIDYFKSNSIEVDTLAELKEFLTEKQNTLY